MPGTRAQALRLRRDLGGLQAAAAEARGRPVSWEDWELADALAQNGQFDDAIDIYRRSGLADVTRNESPLRVDGMHRLVQYAALLQMQGQSVEAGEMLRQPDEFTQAMLAHGARNAAFCYLRARVSMVAGRTEQGFADLEKTMDCVGVAYWTVNRSDRDPVFRDVRTDPRFKAVVERLAARMATMRARLPATFEKHGLAWPPP
jgi:hypothetical protein